MRFSNEDDYFDQNDGNNADEFKVKRVIRLILRDGVGVVGVDVDRLDPVADQLLEDMENKGMFGRMVPAGVRKFVALYDSLADAGTHI